MSVHTLDAPRVSCRVMLPLHRVTPQSLQREIDKLQRVVAVEAAKLPSPRRSYVYITYEEVSEWSLPEPPTAA